MSQTISSGMERGKSFIVVEIIEYVSNSVVIKTIIRKASGNVIAVSFDSGESLAQRIVPYDTFIQVIEGTAEITIDKTEHTLTTGMSIIVPANSPNAIHANERFKMISTTIKSGYDDLMDLDLA